MKQFLKAAIKKSINFFTAEIWHEKCKSFKLLLGDFVFTLLQQQRLES